MARLVWLLPQPVRTKTLENFRAGQIQLLCASDVAAREGAVVRVTDSTVSGTLDVRGTTTRGPTVTIAGGSVPRVRNDANVPGTVIQQ